jgi:hypothetical protein
VVRSQQAIKKSTIALFVLRLIACDPRSGVYFISAGAVLVSGLFYRSVIALEPARDKLKAL